ncbi:MAG: acetoacetate--CoA ligase [Ilumatobacter sp.]|nr:acetoacetate--CoA ligase [Ilumatobacter sp.]
MEPKRLWAPPVDARTSTRLGRFTTYCEQRSGRSFADYDDLWAWSVGEGLEACWAAIWDFFEVEPTTPYDQVLDARTMPGAHWFDGARLNFAEHALRPGRERPDAVAIVGVSQTRDRIELTWRELHDAVARARCGLRRLGVGEGDRVAAYLPNIPETIIAFLATASLGATWTSCAPEFGVRAVLDRFAQVEPTVLLAVDRYRYGRHDVDRSAELASIRAGLPTAATTVVVPYPEAPVAASEPGLIAWADLLAETEPLEFTPVPSAHPLYVLYSSGTTGLPKAIVHGHGGVLVEHYKVIGLHSDLGPDDRFFWFTTTGWMMWNYVVSGLLVGSRLVLFDGDPNFDGPSTLWRLAADEQVTWFGGGAPFFTACMRAGIEPGRDLDLAALRAVGSTGAPLPADAFRWINESVSADVMISPISGGTDVCSAFVGGSPMTPVWEGEIPARYLGAAVHAFDDAGQAVVGEQGELVLTEPMPTMPVGFWGDHDGERYREAYFDVYPGVWRHGDWVVITERGSCVISGRSDATLNRGGVRVGTAEIYRVVEAVDGVANSLVVHLEADDADDPGELVLFVVPADGAHLDDDLVARVRQEIRSGLSPRHVPDEIHEVAVVPTTLSGKKLELPVKRILRGADPDAVASRDALAEPTSLDPIVAIARRRVG